MKIIQLSLVLSVLASCSTAAAADLGKVDRAIKQEPTYKGEPRYCLLVLGPDARFKVWLVLDGKTLYVDRNGNGDLTEAGERVSLTTPNVDPAPFEKVHLVDPDQRKYEMEVHLWRHFENDPNKAEQSISVQWTDKLTFGAWGDEQAPLRFHPRRQDAPVVHVGGPLQMGFEVQQPLVKKGEDYELSVGVGTPGIGPGSFAHLEYNVIPESVHPRAVLEFPNPKGPPIKMELILKERC